VRVRGLGGVTAIAAGSYHGLALKEDGTVWAWGDNGYGQLGDGTTVASSSIPVRVKVLSGVTAIAAGSTFSLALVSDGTVWGWGQNQNGQLAQAAIHSTTTPVRVGDVGGVSAIAAGEFHTLALMQDGTVWAWGGNSTGALGDDATRGQNTPAPAPVRGLAGVRAIAAGGVFSAALKADGTVWAWGDNAHGQLGDG